MRVGIVSTQVPFVTGGAERHSASLAKALRERGHEAAEISIPLKWYPGRILVDHILAAKLIDLSVFEGGPIDLLIGLKFPAYLARHPNKIFWILHQHRQAYEMWDSGASDLLYDADGAAIRDLIREEDRAALAGARVYANSRNVAARLERYLQLPSTTLYHPPPIAGQLRSGPYGDYFFAPSRIGPSKRQDLILEAFAKTRSKARLVFAGPPDSRAYLDTLKDKARKLGIERRVEWLGAIDDATMVRAYAEARAVVFTPVDEDYGYITLEAMLAAKPVITVRDAGGPLEFIQDGKEGFVTAPEAASLADAMDRLADDRGLAERLGQAGAEKYLRAGIGWDKVVATLTGQPAAEQPAPAAPPLPVATSAERADPQDRPAPAQRESAEGEEPSPLLRPADPVDLGQLAGLLAPPQPKHPPFADMAALLGAYRFSTVETVEDPDTTELAAYFGTHWRRYMATLALVQAKPVRRALDVGVFPPFLFQALLAASVPGLKLDGIWEGPQPFAQTVRSRSGEHPDFSIALKPANVERQPMPFEDESFDLVLAMEIFEHFALNPLYFLREAFRVLETGGRLILTTPNVVSHRGVRKALEGIAPYSFGPFIPTGGVYGRHNREFTPHEVAALAEAAGFHTDRLLTADVYDDGIDEETARLLTARGDDFSLRGENILYVGRKEHRPAGPAFAPPAPPPHLYHGDPLQLAARLSLTARDTTSGYATIRIENRSAAPWPQAGAWSASLHLEWSDQFGTLVHGGGRIMLPATVLPGESVDITLALDPGPPDASVGTVLVEMFQDGAGRFAGAGQANQLRLPCSEDAFLRVAYVR